jgi:large subunit ribosomal protein L31e
VQFKVKAPRAVSEIRKFARKIMLTDDVRIDPQLNQTVWSNGIRNLPRRVRVRLSRRKNDGEDGTSKYYTLVQHLDVDSFKGLKTEVTKKD